EAKSAFVIVPDHQLSLAIGKEGQNVRLAARLTGWRIDIRSETQAKEQQDQANAEAAAAAVSNGAAAGAPVTNGTAPEPAAAPGERDGQTEEQPAAGLPPVEEPAPTA